MRKNWSVLSALALILICEAEASARPAWCGGGFLTPSTVGRRRWKLPEAVEYKFAIHINDWPEAERDAVRQQVLLALDTWNRAGASVQFKYVGDIQNPTRSTDADLSDCSAAVTSSGISRIMRVVRDECDKVNGNCVAARVRGQAVVCGANAGAPTTSNIAIFDSNGKTDTNPDGTFKFPEAIENLWALNWSQVNMNSYREFKPTYAPSPTVRVALVSSVLMHELGHVHGFAHDCDVEEALFPSYTEVSTVMDASPRGRNLTAGDLIELFVNPVWRYRHYNGATLHWFSSGSQVGVPDPASWKEGKAIGLSASELNQSQNQYVVKYAPHTPAIVGISGITGGFDKMMAANCLRIFGISSGDVGDRVGGYLTCVRKINASGQAVPAAAASLPLPWNSFTIDPPALAASNSAVGVAVVDLYTRGIRLAFSEDGDSFANVVGPTTGCDLRATMFPDTASPVLETAGAAVDTARVACRLKRVAGRVGLAFSASAQRWVLSWVGEDLKLRVSTAAPDYRGFPGVWTPPAIVEKFGAEDGGVYPSEIANNGTSVSCMSGKAICTIAYASPSDVPRPRRATIQISSTGEPVLVNIAPLPGEAWGDVSLVWAAYGSPQSVIGTPMTYLNRGFLFGSGFSDRTGGGAWIKAQIGMKGSALPGLAALHALAPDVGLLPWQTTVSTEVHGGVALAFEGTYDAMNASYPAFLAALTVGQRQ